MYFEHALDTSSWSDDEEWECTRRLEKASTRLASLLAQEGLDVTPLLTLASLMHEHAREWLDHEDGGHAKRVQAYAAAERLLRRAGVAKPVDSYVLATALVDKDQRGRHDSRAVKRFSKAHGVPIRPEGQRCYVDANTFEQAWRRVQQAGESQLDDIAKRKAAVQAEHRAMNQRR